MDVDLPLWVLLCHGSSIAAGSRADTPRSEHLRTLVLAVGRLRPPFADDVQHYRKLLARHASVYIIELRDDYRVERIIPRDSFVCLLDSAGEPLDSVALSGFLGERRQSRRDLCFVIGGPRGVELSRCDRRLSFGPITLPHQLARVVLLEQLYRAHKILAGEPYHY